MPARRFLGSSMLRGEEGFRDREEQVIRELSAKTGAIIATGGGRRKGRKIGSALRKKETVIHLDC